MQENEKELQSLGVCQRLLNFFMSSLIGSPHKRIAQGSNQAPAAPGGDPSENGVVDKPDREENVNYYQAHQGKSKDDSGSEIQIHFKQTEDEEEELEYWTPIDKLGSSIHDAASWSHDIPRSIGADQSRLKRGGDGDEFDNRTTSSLAAALTQDRLPTYEGAKDQKRNNIVTDQPHHGGLVQVNSVANGTSPGLTQAAGGASESTSTEENKAEKYWKTMPMPKLTLSLEPEAGESKLKPPRRLFHAVSHVNEKSDAYIRTSKEAMQKNRDWGDSGE